MIIPIITIISAISTYFLVKKYQKKKLAELNHRYPAGTHVVISGGSKGIGRSLAKRYAELGTHVTIIARNKSDLENAKKEIEKHRKSTHVQQIRAVSLDLTKIVLPQSNSTDVGNQQQELIDLIIGEHDRCDILINCCGSAIPSRFEDISQQQFHFMMDVNYYSAVNLTMLLLPIMKARSLSSHASISRQTSNGSGHVVFVSSICGLLSFFGYSAYSASKFALVGLAEALHMELRPFDIGVTVSFPPDTDTPGYEAENLMKPNLTSKMSETGNVYSPDQVAQALVNDIKRKKFCSTVGLENHLAVMAMNTFMPSTFTRALFECIIAGPLRLIGYLIVRSWYKIVDEAAPNELNKAKVNLKCSRNGKFEKSQFSTSPLST